MKRKKQWKNFRHMQLATGLAGVLAVFLPILQTPVGEFSAWNAVVFVFTHLSTFIDMVTQVGQFLGQYAKAEGATESVIMEFVRLFVVIAMFLSILGIGLDRLVRWHKKQASSGLVHATVASLSILMIATGGDFDWIGYGYWLWVAVAFAGPALYFANRNAIEEFADGTTSSDSDSEDKGQSSPADRPRRGEATADADESARAIKKGVHDYECGNCGESYRGKLMICGECETVLRYD